eukprot:g354.t1
MASKITADGASDIEDDRELMDRFSRQIGAFGTTMMSKLIKMKVLIRGVSGVGAEVAKNLILLGPKKVTLSDPTLVSVQDLGANFTLEEKDVKEKRSRARASVGELAQLNAACDVGVLMTTEKKSEDDDSGELVEAQELTEELLDEYDVLVMCDASRSEISKWNAYCRGRKRKVPEARGGAREEPDPIGFIAVHCRGASGTVFTDFGDAFEIFDDNGEAVTERLISDVTNDAEGGVVHVLEAQPRQKLRNITDGFVQLTEVEGCYAKTSKDARDIGYQNINEAPLWRVTNMQRQVYRNKKNVKVFDPLRYKIGDTSRLSRYEKGGILKEVKVPKTVSFRSFVDSMRNPGDAHPATDMVKFDWMTMTGPWHHMHIAYVAVMEFQEKSSRLPVPNCEKDAAAILELAKAYNEAMRVVNETLSSNPSSKSQGWYVDKLDENLVLTYARYAACELQPVCTFLGGVVAQEVAKWTGKFTPNPGFLHLDFSEILPETRPTDTAPLGGRYDHQIAVFGKSFQEKLGNIRTFMVGCGALGCELLKNFAMMGIACGSNGLITVTDDDKIEVSNLNRQFLFRSENVQQYKADAATSRVRTYNPSINVRTEKIKVMPATENVFDETFWHKQDFITNALDNIKARLYVDGQCVRFEKPLLESGTLGTKCNTVIVVPHKTKSYADGQEKEGGHEAEIPMCTLRNFPTLLDHCVEWARAKFTDLFESPVRSARAFGEDPDAFFAKMKTLRLAGTSELSAIEKAMIAMREIRTVIDFQRDATFETCVAFAWKIFHEHFRDVIASLLRNFPADAKDSQTGMPFWNAKKKMPHPLSANFDDGAYGKHALQFVTSFANIYAAAIGLVPAPDGAKGLLPLEHPYRDESKIRAICAKLEVPDIVYDQKVGEEARKKKKEGDDDDAAAKKEDEEADEDSSSQSPEAILASFDEMLKWFESNRAAVVANKEKFNPADFEKDQDMNFHIDFIESYSNLRANAYNIKTGTRHKCKMIAGKILPAILTATASITGLIMIELYKLVQNKPLNAVRNAFCNLGVNVYNFENPDPIPVEKGGFDEAMQEDVKVWPAKGFTKWDKVVVDDGDMTVGEFIAHIKKLTGGLSVAQISHPISSRSVKEDAPKPKGHGAFLYNADGWSKVMRETAKKRLVMKLSEVIRTVHDVPENATSADNLSLTLRDDDDVEYKHPRLIFTWARAKKKARV